jgi:CelD/BcsL family acetyltransferase involved in cellulose biosynthesis
MATLSSPAAPGERIRTSEPVELAIDDPRWEAFVLAHDEALAFHHPRWTQLLVDCYGFRPFVVAVLDRDGQLAAGLPLVEAQSLRSRRWIGLPFTDACPPLLAPGVSPAGFAKTLDELRRSSGVSSLEVRSAIDGAGARERCDAVVHTTQLGDDPEALFKLFHKSQVQRNVRRAEREDVVVRIGDEERDLTNTFYGLHAQTRRRLGAPVQPRRFFVALWRRLLEPGLGRLLIASAGEQPIAAAVFVAGPRTLTYKFGASDSRFWGLRPNHLIFWSAIRWACESGFERLDFGRSDLEDQGLRDFKKGWAATEEPLVYTTFGAGSEGGVRSFGAARAVLRRSPVWVCRAAGELLYRRAA